MTHLRWLQPHCLKFKFQSPLRVFPLFFFPACLSRFDIVAHIVRKRDGHGLTAADLESYRVKNVGANPEARAWSEGEKKTLLWNLVRREPLQEEKKKKHEETQVRAGVVFFETAFSQSRFNSRLILRPSTNCGYFLQTSPELRLVSSGWKQSDPHS